MRVLIPDEVFSSFPGQRYVYLYSKFGVRVGAEGGFEEWGVIPAPGAAVLGLEGLSCLTWARRRIG